MTLSSLSNDLFISSFFNAFPSSVLVLNNQSDYFRRSKTVCGEYLRSSYVLLAPRKNIFPFPALKELLSYMAQGLSDLPTLSCDHHRPLCTMLYRRPLTKLSSSPWFVFLVFLADWSKIFAFLCALHFSVYFCFFFPSFFYLIFFLFCFFISCSFFFSIFSFLFFSIRFSFFFLLAFFFFFSFLCFYFFFALSNV